MFYGLHNHTQTLLTIVDLYDDFVLSVSAYS